MNEINKAIADDIERAAIDIKKELTEIDRRRPTPAALPPIATSTIDQLFETYNRAGPALRQRIVAERGDLTSKFERDMAAHIEASRAKADELRTRYEQRLNELDQIARRISE